MYIFENTFLCILFIWLLFNRKLQQKVTTRCWQYHIRNVLHEKPMTILENTFKCKLFILFLFNRKLQQIVRIYCWQYHFWNVLPDKPMTILENTFKCKLIFDYFVNYNKKWGYVVDNIIFGTSYPINLRKSLKTHFYVYYLFIIFAS